ncbi:MAG: acetyltransferase [Planctomycetes bacterium]|nr:acetyltransferase [Planctomycetota bacterium]
MEQVTKVVILGAGPHAGVLVDILRHDPLVDIVGFTDIEPSRTTPEFHRIPILGDDRVLADLREISSADALIVGLGWELLEKRRALVEHGTILGYKWVRAIHPKSILTTNVFLGEGTAVMAGAVVGPYSVIGKHSVVNTSCSIDHDAKIEDNVFVGPGAVLGGNVTVGSDTVIGLGANVFDGITIGSNATVGAGALVNKNVPDGATVVGVPAKVLRWKDGYGKKP